MNILGVDPGGRATGLCKIRQDRTVVGGCVISRTKEDWKLYLCELRDAIDDLVEEKILVAIEAVTKPKAYFNSKKQILPVDGVMGTSRVYGALEMYLLSLGFDAIVIQPGGNGSGDLANYPPELVGAREKKAGTGILNHVRSAYDIAKMALVEMEMSR